MSFILSQSQSVLLSSSRTHRTPKKIVMDSFVTVDKVMTHGASAAILCKVLETHLMYSLIQKCLMKKSIARPTATQIVDELENSKEVKLSVSSG